MQCSPENSYVLKKKNKKNKYKTQFTINTPIIKMLKKRSNINNNLSCKKHRTHILDLSFRRNNLKIGLSALSKKPPWLLHDLKNFWNFLPDFSRFSLTFQNINHISRFSRFSRLVWTMYEDFCPSFARIPSVSSEITPGRNGITNVPASYKHKIKTWLYAYHLVYCSVLLFVKSRLKSK